MLMKLVIRWRPLVLWGLMLLGLALRLYGLNWDQGNSFHPDERHERREYDFQGFGNAVVYGTFGVGAVGFFPS